MRLLPLFILVCALCSVPALAHDYQDEPTDSAGAGSGGDPVVTAGTSFGSAADDGCTLSKCGSKSGLVPAHKDFIHASLYWKQGESKCPTLLVWMRPSEFKPIDYVHREVNETTLAPIFREDYLRRVQGGFPLGQLDESGWSRYAPDMERENAQIIDVCGLSSLIAQGGFTKEDIASLTFEDMTLTDPFFHNAGFSRGLGYNLFCDGGVQGTDGRIYVVGLHDKGGNNGGRKVHVWDSENDRWVPRQAPCTRLRWETDSEVTPDCDPLNEDHTDPPLLSDMTYQRWYPTAVALPDGRILVLSGTDQNSSLFRDGGDDAVSASKIMQVTPEVYDPVADRTVALESARKHLNTFPRSFVVQTGPCKNDWKVAVVSETVPPFPGEPGGPDIMDYDPFIYRGHTRLFDVQAALSDVTRSTPASNHWSDIIDIAGSAHDSGAGVSMVRVQRDGSWSQELFLFGGSNNDDGPSNVSEAIDFSTEQPRWRRLQDLVQPVTQNNVVALPDGKLLVVGGRGNGINSFGYQLYDPHTGLRTIVATTTVPRYDHSTALIMPSGEVWIMGGNRVNLIPGAGPRQTQSDRNAAVPVLESYKPPYFFKGARPIIEEAPSHITYGGTFRVKLSTSDSSGKHSSLGSHSIAAVALLRTGLITHNWAWSNQYVKLPVTYRKNGVIGVMSPPLPGLAVAGDYLMFVVAKCGAVSEGRRVRLKL